MDFSSQLTSPVSPSMRDCSEKSILTKQIGNIIYLFSYLFIFYLIIDLADEKFYIINIQTLCKTDNGDRLPCEIGAIEYSLRGGITKTLHRFIEPGKTVIS